MPARPNTTHTDASSGGPKDAAPVSGRYLVASLLIIGASLGAIGIAARAADASLRLPEIVLTLLLLFGIVILLASIAALVVLLAGFRLADDKEALGLPSGSVRAIIALTLILVFAIVSVFLFWNTGHISHDSIGLKQAQISLLPQDQIVSIVATGADSFTVTTVDNAFANQLAQQLMTILGTLVTAVAAFYFGAKSVSAGVDLGKKAANEGTAAGAEIANATDATKTTVTTTTTKDGDTTKATATTQPSGTEAEVATARQPSGTEAQVDTAEHPDATKLQPTSEANPMVPDAPEGSAADDTLNA